MIQINLTPHRELARKQRQQRFFFHIGISAMAGLVFSGVLYATFQLQIDSQRNRNTFLSVEVKKLEDEIKEIAGLQSEIVALKARQAAVENLQADRNLPVHLLTEIARQTPDGVYLVSMKQTDQTVLLMGMAQSQERVSQLLRALGSSERLRRPELVEIVSKTENFKERDKRTVFSFTVRAQLERADEFKALAPKQTASSKKTNGKDAA